MMGKGNSFALAALASALLMLAPQTSAQEEGEDDLTGGIVIFPPANVPKELNGMPPVPEAVSGAIDNIVPGAGGFFGGLFDTPDCPDTGCPPPAPAPPPVWLQPISPPYDATTAAPLTGGLGDLVDDVTDTSKTEDDGNDLDGFLGFRTYSVGGETPVDDMAPSSTGSTYSIVHFAVGFAVLTVLTFVALRPTGGRSGAVKTSAPNYGSIEGSIDISTPRVEYQQVSTSETELPL